MRANHADERTADPVELERRLLALEGENAEPGVARKASGWTLSRKMAVAVSIALIIGYLLLWAQNVQESGGPEGYIRGNDQRGPVDFISTLTGARVIHDGNGARLYDLDVQRDAQNRIFEGYRRPLGTSEILPYNHMPFEALFIAPFIDLPAPIVFALWTLISGIAVGMSLGLLDSALPVPRPVGWVLSMAACSYLPLIRSLMLGQNSPLVLLGLCGLFVTLKRGQYGWAGASLALVALKPQILPAILLLMLLLRHWRALAVFVGIMLGASLAAMALLGPGWVLDYVKLLLGVANWGSTGAIDPAIMHNWRGLLTNLLGNSGAVMPLFVVLSLLTLGLVVFTWARTRNQGTDSHTAHHYSEYSELWPYRPERDLLWALTGIAAVLTSLHLNPHDLTLLVLPAWILGAYATSGIWGKSLSRIWIALLAVGYVIGPLTLTQPRAVVIPSVLLMALSAALLAWVLATEPAPAPEPALT